MPLLLLIVIVVMLPVDARAQADVGISGVGLLSIQPIDDSYVGDPYLSEGIGGLAGGVGAGLNVILPGGLVVAGEYTTAWYEQQQSGRLVLGGFPLESIPATTRLRDSMVSILAGYATAGSTRAAFYGGVSFKLDLPTINDVAVDNYDNGDDLPVAFTGGVDLLRRLSSRAELVIGGRYTFDARSTRLQYLGIGPHIIRAGAGVRVRLN